MKDYSPRLYRIAAIILALSCSGDGSPTAPASVETVEVNPGTVSLFVAQKVSLSATAHDPKGNALTGRTISWTSGDTAVASVSTFGEVTATGVGKTTIIAQSEGKVGSVNVTVTLAPVATLVITPPSLALAVGTSLPLAAQPRDLDGRALSGRAVSWGSTDSTIASVSLSGSVTAIKEGSATIKATAEGVTAFATVTVTPAPIAVIVITPSVLTLTVGQAASLAAEPRDANGRALSGRTVTWSSSDSSVARIGTSGAVTALRVGVSTITAASEGKSATAQVTVTPVSVFSVTISPSPVTVSVGAISQLVAEVRDQNGQLLAGRAIAWMSADSSIARISSGGLVTGLKQGITTITATSEGKSGTGSITVTPAAITTCKILSTSGDYVLNGDIGADGGLTQYSKQFCLVVQNSNNVRIDCQGHVIYGLHVTNVANIAVTNCIIDYTANNNRARTAFWAVNATNLSIDQSTFYVGLAADGLEGGNISNNVVSGLGIALGHAHRVVINNNVVDWRRPADEIPIASIGLSNGSGNVIRDNVLDGGWNGDISNWGTVGADDGILIVMESSDTVANNRMSNTWDAGIETVGNVSNSLFANNSISNTVIGIGGWWDTNLQNTTFSNNSVSRAHSLFTFTFDQTNGLSTPCAFVGNQFLNNRISNIIDAGIAHNVINGFNFDRSGISCAVRGNRVEGNDYGNLAVVITPRAGFTP